MTKLGQPGSFPGTVSNGKGFFVEPQFLKDPGNPDSGYNMEAVNKAIGAAYRGTKGPTAKQRSVTHALLKGRGDAAVADGATLSPAIADRLAALDAQLTLLDSRLGSCERQDAAARVDGNPTYKTHPNGEATWIATEQPFKEHGVEIRYRSEASPSTQVWSEAFHGGQKIRGSHSSHPSGTYNTVRAFLSGRK